MKRRAIIAFLLLVTLLMVACSAKPVQPQSLLGLTYTIQDFDAQGKLVARYTESAHSYVQGFLDIIYVHCTTYAGGVSTITIKDTGGTNRNLQRFNGSAANVDLRADAGNGVTTYGIVVGSGTNAVTETDYALQTLITHGTGAGQLNYGTTTFTAPATVGATTSFTISRTVTNGTANPVTVNEIGIYSPCYYWTGSTTLGYFCIIRDVLGAGQVIASTHNLAVTYTISVSN